MTALLFLLGAVLLLAASLYLYLTQDALKAWWYRLFKDPDGKSGTEEPTYERARLLDEVGPCIVASSDLDRADRQGIAKVNARLARILAEDKELAELDALDLSAYYVPPATSPEVQR